MIENLKFYFLRLIAALIPFVVFFPENISAKEFTETSFLIAGLKPPLIENQQFWTFIQSNNRTGIEVDIFEENKQVYLEPGKRGIDFLIDWLDRLTSNDSSKVIPVFLNYTGTISVLDSIISQTAISSRIFYMPRGEAWPPLDYLVQSNRRILFFVSGNKENGGRVVHRTDDYIHRISASPGIHFTNRNSLELFLIYDFDKLPTGAATSGNIRNLVPDYVNFLLESWTKYGKRPNFIFVGERFLNFDFILPQLNSFTWVNGTVRGSGKTIERIYWKNPEVSVTSGKFSFPYRGGDELTLTPFVPGYRMTPEQIIVTGEMEVPENYQIIASPLKLNEGLTGSFRFDETIIDEVSPQREFQGENYSFSQDLERGTVLRLPENSNVNLGPPDRYGLRNSSFTVSCFVKFSEILEFGDNAVLGNYESEYRRGLHLILRSGHPYFGLWANDYVSEEKLEPNTWYHLVWRYIIETGEQAIFLNGQNIGSSDGHPPFSGTGDIHLGSALSQGASLRGSIDELHFWNRPLGAEEITRLALNENITVASDNESETGFLKKYGTYIIWGLFLFIGAIIFSIIILVFRKKRKNEPVENIRLPEKNQSNQIKLFGGFKAVDREGNDISGMFTPKVRELFLFVLLSTLKNKTGAAVSETDEQLWSGLPSKKVANNRAVTLNKLRKILNHIDGLEIITNDGFLLTELREPLFCDYAEAYKLCQSPGGMDKKQLETFFHLVKKGRFLKGINWEWLDEMRGFTGNQIIDNLLKLAVFYKNENKISNIEALAKRILEYDDLNEEAIWLQVWVLRQTNNLHQAKFHFESFCSKYRNGMGEKYPMDFEKFNRHFSYLF